VPVPLVVVAHGSRDSRSAATIRALVRDIDAHVSFLDLSRPLLTDVLRPLYAEGHRDAVVVPLLLGKAYHARVDLPALVRGVPRLRVSISDVLGIDPVLETVALDRLRETGADLGDPELGVVLAAVGSSRAPANEAVAQLARSWHARHRMLVTPAFASRPAPEAQHSASRPAPEAQHSASRPAPEARRGAARPDLPAAIAKLRAQGARRFAVASWFLAPGLLPDRVATLARAADPDILVAQPLAPDARVAELILHRYDEAVTGGLRTA
jgi:sirohydrochlorin ferrochelatase